jgi:hypothetical protein
MKPRGITGSVTNPWKLTSISLHREEDRELWAKAKKIAIERDISLSELVLLSLAKEIGSQYIPSRKQERGKSRGRKLY